jgi:hypothetical protein
MTCCSVRASRALLIGSEYVLTEVAVCCLSIAQRAPVLEREPRFVPTGSALQSDRAKVQAKVE